MGCSGQHVLCTVVAILVAMLATVKIRIGIKVILTAERSKADSLSTPDKQAAQLIAKLRVSSADEAKVCVLAYCWCFRSTLMDKLQQQLARLDPAKVRIGRAGCTWRPLMMSVVVTLP